jgi:hypothetical protein
MRGKFNEDFYDLYNNGFKEYEHGDWEKAKTSFKMANVI